MDCNEYVNQAVAFYKNGELGKALVNFEAALKIQPDNAQIRQLVNQLKEIIGDKSQREFYEAEASRWDKLSR